ncbi:MAG: polymer-forming cytoskeletal protein [Actinobacteria bacterium]|nr:polymer-forming cytoskeletal protein [Actinomycetota bacterium]
MSFKVDTREQKEIVTKSGERKILTVIGNGDRVEGKIKVSNSVRIDGEVLGEIHSAGLVIVGKDASVGGNIFSAEATVAGRVEGGIEASGTVELESKCFFKGDLKAKNLVVHEGAIFLGQVSMEIPEDVKNLGKVVSSIKDEKISLESEPEDEFKIAPDIKKF